MSLYDNRAKKVSCVCVCGNGEIEWCRLNSLKRLRIFQIKSAILFPYGVDVNVGG